MTNGVWKGTRALWVEAMDWEGGAVRQEKWVWNVIRHQTVLSACADYTMSPSHCSTTLHTEVCSTVLRYRTAALECSVGTVPTSRNHGHWAGSYIRVTRRFHTTAKWWSPFKRGEKQQHKHTELTQITPMRWWWSRGGVQKKRGGNRKVWRESEVCCWRWQVVCIFCQTTTRSLKNEWNNVFLTVF